ncbi:MAG: DUF6345 domain-containing protein [archaeon]
MNVKRNLILFIVCLILFSFTVSATCDDLADETQSLIMENQQLLTHIQPLNFFLDGMQVEIVVEGCGLNLQFIFEDDKINFINTKDIDFTLTVAEKDLTDFLSTENQGLMLQRLYINSQIGIEPHGFFNKLKLFLIENLAKLNFEDESPKVEFYSGFEEDLVEILNSDDNVLITLSSTARLETEKEMVELASAFGVKEIKTLEDKSKIGVMLDNEGNLDASFVYFAPNETDDEELLAVRSSLASREGSLEPLQENEVWQTAEEFLQSNKLDLQTQLDQRQTAAIIYTKDVTDEGSFFVLQTAGFYRLVGGRQVSNSLIQVEVNSLTGEVTGVSLRNWVLSTEKKEEVLLKNVEKLKKEITEVMAYEAGESHNIYVTNCESTYFQSQELLLPTVTCHGTLVKDGNLVAYSPVVTSTSLTPMYYVDKSLGHGKFPCVIDEHCFDYDDDGGVCVHGTCKFSGAVSTTKPPQSGEPLPGDVAGAKFAVYYSTDEDLFETAAKEFRDEFKDYWPDYDKYLSYKNRFVEDSYDYADDVDLLFLFGHGYLGSVWAEDQPIYLYENKSSALYDYFLSQLGEKDLEYLAQFSCLSNSVVYCQGDYGRQRYTTTSDSGSVFAGLHTLSGMHGSLVSNTYHSKKVSKKFAAYLEADYSIVDAWAYALLDTNSWLVNRDNSCHEVSDPENHCTVDAGSSCSRYRAYPTTYYISGNIDESLSDWSSVEMDDRRYGGKNYAISVLYTYQSETVPIFSSGYSLP